MKKINRAGGLTLSLLLLISTILSVLVIPLPIAQAYENSATVATVTINTAVNLGSQRKGFYSAGLLWAFYSEGTNAMYKTTSDPEEWAGGYTNIGACHNGYSFSVWFDGTYVHYVRFHEYDTFYRRGTPQSNGTILWSWAEQTVHDGDEFGYYIYPHITVDSSGYAWIGALHIVTPQYRPTILKNSENDGSWTTDFITALSEPNDITWRVCPIALTDDKMYVVYCRTGQLPLGKLYDEGWGDEENDLVDNSIERGSYYSALADGDDVHFIYNRDIVNQIRYNNRTFGEGWGTDDVLVQANVTSLCGPALSIYTLDDELYCFWTSIETDHVYYKIYSDGSWDTDPTDWIDESTDGIHFDNLISSWSQYYGEYIGLLYVTNVTNLYKVRFNFVPPLSNPVPSDIGSNETVELRSCEFSTYWDDGRDDGLDYWIFSWDESGSYVNDTAVEFSGNPDKAWSNVTKILPDYPQTIHWKIYANDTLGYWAVTAEQTLIITKTWNANVTFPPVDGPTEFNWSSSWGDSAFWYTNYSWVFEGKKRYNFDIYYENTTLGTVQQIGLRFKDSINDVHTIWYDKDANTLTVTSPGDGISGWVQSFTQTSTNLTATFQIMFNSPIPDSYDVQLEIRVITEIDTDWDEIEGGIFNIYNLGGLATLFKDATAGRISGGDIFEIYAADTRTRNIIPVQDFDVRASNLAPGVQILGIQIIPAVDEQWLIDELHGWKIWMTSRTETRTIYPTNRLPDTGVSGDKTYVSYPFGLLIKSDSTTNQSLIIERQFFRKIDEADNEIVTVEIWATVANDTKITGQILISDDGYVDDLLKGLVTDTKRIVDFKFYGNGSIRLVDGIFNIYPATYTGMVWANYTFVMNLTAQTYDFYVDEVLKVPGVDFREAATSVGHVSFLDTLNPVFPAQPVEFYVDDVWAHTDFDENYGGVAEATMLFDKNQHWSMDFDFFVEHGEVYAQGVSGTPQRVGDDYSDHGYVELGWDIMINNTLVHDFLVARINITDGYISGKNDWIKFNVTWYSQGEYVKHDLLYGLFEGYSIFPGECKDTSGWHWDIWFNRANASTIVGARLNTEYFGMSDKSVWWAIWSSKWQPMRTEVSESTIFIDLEDANGTIHSAQDVSFVRSWVKVLRTIQAEFAYKVINIGGLDFMIATDTMSGIDTPPIRETVVPEVMSGFFGSALGGIFSAALKRLGNSLAGFGMGFFTMSIDFIDAVFAALGYPALVSTIFGWMDSLFASVPILLGHGLTLIEQIFRLVTVSASDTLNQLTSIITIWVNMYSSMMDLLTDGFDPAFNLWNDLGINSFIQIGVVLYPLWLLMMGFDKGFQAVIDHVNGVLNIGGFFLNFILNVGGFFMSLLTGLIGAIRG